ncbi:sigma-70 family RNA polymerase sigma factor [Dolichospermum lemmermannii CS-548]|uniref:sigma-70 family RNA polymerase sigma factor n=1 Tax=Dolichospermum lemmermannii TaxID=54295 RepID=UPI00232C576A|nr:sigma-70 family RNA polymerase sigma factor [Dolichospermum lemmermannii]MDB9437917.1 sigma-70 family RNA polymerase sigma factor [Dolichospermum lemmermannii CS-548]
MLSAQESWSYSSETWLDSNYRQRLKKIAHKYTRGTGISWEDAVQNAHLKIFQGLQSGKFREGGLEEFYRWAATVARCAIIDFVRQENLRKCQSLDCNIPGTDIALLDTITDEFNILEATERADLILKAIEKIYQLDQQYPRQNYLKLWQGKIDGKTQTQLAGELRVSQSEISKRWQELLGRIADSLGLLKVEDLKGKLQENRQQKREYNRSTKQW